MLTLSELNLHGQHLVIREDFNVPLNADGTIANDERIQAALPTLKMAREAGASVVILSHLGRPTEGKFDAKYSLKPVAERLSELLKCNVPLIDVFQENWDINHEPGSIALLENVRFLPGEKANSKELAERLAQLGNIYVMDAFGCAHRAQASTEKIIEMAQTACAGPLLERELRELGKAFDKPQSPVVALIGGSKVSTKLSVLKSVLNKVDILIIGGGMANTFLKAQEFNIGKSLVELELVEEAKLLLRQADDMGKQILLPTDVIVADEVSDTAQTQIKQVSDIYSQDMILDIGPKTSAAFARILQDANTIIWNGPVGVFECKPFRAGTKAISDAIASSKAFSVAGGGDTLSAIELFKIKDKISYISTGGGAFLEFLEGKMLPAVKALEEKNKHTTTKMFCL